MANIKSQIKRVKTNAARTERNRAYKSELRTWIRKFRAAAEAGDPQWTHLWAGAGWRRTASAMPGRMIDGDAGRITRWLAGREG